MVQARRMEYVWSKAQEGGVGTEQATGGWSRYIARVVCIRKMVPIISVLVL